ncbi:MAG: hypothetical protein JNG88_00480 [Phycisphaerales bacterium]|nr:hypothetical protein [Phycisphaerales bacterium]
MLTLDSMRSREIADYYRQPWLRDPQPGELFVAEFRLRVNEEDLFAENGIVIARAEGYGYLEILVGFDNLVILPTFTVIPIAPRAFHTLSLYSVDMDRYDFFVDGALMHSGRFENETLNSGFCSFGDAVVGAASQTEWDCARFLIVPEPSSMVGLLILWLLVGRKMSARRSVVALCAFALASNVALAHPVSIVYEGDDFPENVGWDRHTQYGGSERSLIDGALTLNSTTNPDVVDYYQQPWLNDPSSGAVFVVEVRTRVTQGDFFPKSSFGVARAESPGWVEVAIGYDSLIVLPFWAEIPLAPASWHTVALRSPDMLSFDLFVDGAFVHHGMFETETLNQGFCWFGDSFARVLSHTEWDYARFLIVPEPFSLAGMLVLGLLAWRRANARRAVTAWCALALASNAALADPVSIVYEGDDYPENVGWQRFTQYGGAERALRDGVLTLDSMSSRDIADYYQQPWLRDPESGELFVAEFRVRVQTEDLFPDNGIIIARGEHFGYVELLVGYDQLIVLPHFAILPLAPATWHGFTLRSSDMVDFDLFVDGALAHSGTFETETLNRGFCGFGDGVVNASSYTEWDYARFRIIPEPASFAGFAITGLLFMLTNTRALLERRRHTHVHLSNISIM